MTFRACRIQPVLSPSTFVGYVALAKWPRNWKDMFLRARSGCRVGLQQCVYRLLSVRNASADMHLTLTMPISMAVCIRR